MCRNKNSQGPRPCMGVYATTRVGQKVTVEVSIHDGMLDLRPNGAGNKHLRCDLWDIFEKMYR